MTNIGKMAQGLWPLLAAVVLFVAAGSLQNAALSYHLANAGVSAAATSFLIALYFGGFLAGAYLGPRLVAMLGHVRAFILPAVAAGLCLPLLAFTHHMPSITLLQLVTGFGIACQYVVIESWLNLEADSSFRARLFGLYMICWFAGAAGGPLLMMLGGGGSTLLFVTAGVMVLASTLLVWRVRTQAWRGALSLPMPLAPVWRACPAGFSATLLVGISFGAVLGLTATYGQHRGLSAPETSLFVAAFIVGGGATQYLAGWLSDKVGRLPVLFAFTLMAMLAAALCLAAKEEIHLYMAALAFGGFALPIYALGVAQVQDFVPARDRVAASGGLLVLNGIGSFAGPLLISGLSAPYGPDALFIVLTSAHALLALTVLLLPRAATAPAAN